jgi:hypothetical protein
MDVDFSSSNNSSNIASAQSMIMEQCRLPFKT